MGACGITKGGILTIKGTRMDTSTPKGREKAEGLLSQYQSEVNRLWAEREAGTIEKAGLAELNELYNHCVSLRVALGLLEAEPMGQGG